MSVAKFRKVFSCDVAFFLGGSSVASRCLDPARQGSPGPRPNYPLTGDTSQNLSKLERGGGHAAQARQDRGRQTLSIQVLGKRIETQLDRDQPLTCVAPEIAHGYPALTVAAEDFEEALLPEANPV